MESTDSPFLCDPNGHFGISAPVKFPFNYTITVNASTGFVAPGTYYYACSIHCILGMRGTITVQNACLGQSFPSTTTTTTAQATSTAPAVQTSSRAATTVLASTTRPGFAALNGACWLLLLVLVLAIY